MKSVKFIVKLILLLSFLAFLSYLFKGEKPLNMMNVERQEFMTTDLNNHDILVKYIKYKNKFDSNGRIKYNIENGDLIIHLFIKPNEENLLNNLEENKIKIIKNTCSNEMSYFQLTKGIKYYYNIYYNNQKIESYIINIDTCKLSNLNYLKIKDDFNEKIKYLNIN